MAIYVIVATLIFYAGSRQDQRSGLTHWVKLKPGVGDGTKFEEKICSNQYRKDFIKKEGKEASTKLCILSNT